MTETAKIEFVFRMPSLAVSEKAFLVAIWPKC